MPCPFSLAGKSVARNTTGGLRRLTCSRACRGFLQHGGELFGIPGWRLAGGLDTDERLGLGGAEMRQSILQRGGERIGCETLGSNAKDGFAETENAGGGIFEALRLRVIRAAGNNHLQRMARMENCGQSISGGEQAVLRGDAREGFEGALGPIAVARVSGVRPEAIERERSDRIRGWRGRVLDGLAADVEAAHRGGIRGTVEKASAFGVAEFFNDAVESALGGAEIARVES